jgi:arylsulfatase A-like enzyme
VSNTSFSARALLALLLCVGASCGDPPRKGPNVVLIVMDTTRADRCSFLGYGRETTPRLAEFAKDAVSFRDAWSPAGWTGPAHASLFTGLRPEHHGFHDGDRNFLGAEFPTLAEQFGKAGYATACFTNNDWVAPDFGLARGFQVYEPMFRRQGLTPPTARPTHDEAARWCEETAAAGRPFFLFVNDMEPHMPFDPPADVAARFVRGAPSADDVAEARLFQYPRSTAYSLRAEEIAPQKLALLSDLYDAEIATLDREIGALFDRLDKAGLLRSAVVVVTSDHGELLGEHHMIEHGHSLHRAARHVPLLIRSPGRFVGGRVVESVARLEDVPPTLLELCGLPVPPNLDGASLLADVGKRISRAVQGANASRRASLVARHPGVETTRFLAGATAVYDGRFELLTWTDGGVELYEVAKDPDETTDLAKSLPDEVERLRALSR